MPDSSIQSTQTEKQPVILLCFSSSPSSRRVIRCAGRYLSIPGSRGIGLYVHTPSSVQKDDIILRENISEAKKAGFEIHTVESNNLVLSIAEFAEQVGATDLFLGYTAPPVLLQTKKPVSEQLAAVLTNVDIHVIPDRLSSPVPQMRRSHVFLFNFRDVFKVAAVMLAATLLSWWFYESRYSNANISTIYILGVLAASLWTSHQIYGILAAILYILLFNYLFIDPRFTLLVYNAEYLMTYFVSVLAALITGSLAARLKTIARRSAENAYQAKVLLDTSNQLERASDSAEIIRITCMQLVHLLNRSVLFYPSVDSDPYFYSADDMPIDQNRIASEKDAVVWTADHRHHSGAGTSDFPDCRYRYLSIHTDSSFYGIIGIELGDHPLSDFETTILHSILHEFTMALDNLRMAGEHREAELAAEKEHLRAGLLRSISHDLRTPLTAIFGHAANLSENSSQMSEEDKQQIYQDIEQDSRWLNEQMENILSMTKLENDPSIQISVENVEDVIEESLVHVGPHPNHPIRVELPDQPLFASMNARLIMQVLVNLFSNAIKYTPDGTEITAEAYESGGKIYVEVKDTGPGISDEDKTHIFDLFYTGSHPLSDSYRSMGIGLNLCAMIMNAHGETIEVLDNDPHGALFRFSLEASEVNYE